jgi:hypothetical protein
LDRACRIGGKRTGAAGQLDAYALQDAGLDTYEANVALGHREDERSLPGDESAKGRAHARLAADGRVTVSVECNPRRWCRSRKDQQVGVVHGDRELPGGCLRQTSAGIAAGLGSQLDALLARGTDPPGEPLRSQVGL